MRYRTEFSDVPGFLEPDSLVLWDFFFGAQDRLWVTGDFLEVGVYRGKSAVLGTLYMRPAERSVFVDLAIPEDTRNLILGVKREGTTFLERRSCDLLAEPALREAPNSFRWCHIDGDHTGYSTLQDLGTAAYLTNERGIICVDDFFNIRYPQLTAAVYQFLQDHGSRFRMFFCGANKCYICRAGAYAAYEGYIRNNLAAQLRANDIEGNVFKTSYAYDYGCFSLGKPEGGRPVHGMDENPDFVPF
jgi:hypothetical protein